MAGETPNTTPDPLAGTASAGNAAAPTAAPAASAPPSSGLTPGEQSAIADFKTAANDERQAAATNVAPPPPGPHARLFKMVEALGVGLSSSATALATRGKEGGAPEVENYYAQKQAQAIQAQNARTALRDENVRIAQQAMATATAQYQMWHNISMLPNQVAMSDLSVKAAQAEVTGKNLENQKARLGLIQAGMAPSDATSDEIKAVQTNRLNQIGPSGEGSVYLKGNPILATTQKVLTDPNATQEQKDSAWAQYNSALNVAKGGEAAQMKQTQLGAAQARLQLTSDIFAKADVNPQIIQTSGFQQEMVGIIQHPETYSPPEIAKAQDYLKRAQAAQAQQVANQVAVATARGTAYQQAKIIPVIDTDGNLTYKTAGEAAAQHLTPLQGGQKAMSQLAQMTDIRQSSENLRAAIQAGGATLFTPDQIAKLQVAMTEKNPTVANREFQALAASNLTPAQQNYIVWLRQMSERALSIRNIAGIGGAGSDQTRAAILETLPTLGSGNTQLALKQLDAVDNLVANLSRGIPGVNVHRTGMGAEQGATPQTPPKKKDPFFVGG